MSIFSSSFRNPVITDSLGADHGDPFVLRYLDQYYLYHTGKRGISVYTSPDLAHWEFKGFALTAQTGVGHWAEIDLWAPEVFYHEGTFFMYVAGTRALRNGGDDHARRQGLARSQTPLGPFQWDDRPLIPEEWSIDGHPYRDEDGSLWLYYNIRTEATRYRDGTIGCGNVVEQMEAPDRRRGPQIPVTFPTERWEGNREGTWYWNEGPVILKRRGIYYQMYSGGCYADDTYAVGVATAPTPAGPWVKDPANPQLISTAGIRGPGHHSVTTGPDGATLYAVYHGFVPGEKGRKVHIDRLYWAGDRPVIAGPTEGEQPVPHGPAYDPGVPHWRAELWVRGSEVRVAGLRVGLPSPAYHRITAAGTLTATSVWLDGVLCHRAAGGLSPFWTAEGEVRQTTLTSSLDVEEVTALGPGESRSWAWGSDLPLEVSVAVQGEVTVAAGGVVQRSDGPPGEYRLVRLLAPDGAREIRITAGPAGAVVTDLFAAARPQS